MEEFPKTEICKEKYKFLNNENDHEVCKVPYFYKERNRTFNINNLASDIFHNSKKIAISFRNLTLIGFFIALPHSLLPSFYRLYQHHTFFGTVWYEHFLVILSIVLSTWFFNLNLLFILNTFFELRR